MKTTIDINIKEFKVPNTVQEDFAQPAPMPAPLAVGESNPDYRPPLEYLLSELSAETLDKLCENFRTEVFKKAGKRQPESVSQA